MQRAWRRAGGCGPVLTRVGHSGSQKSDPAAQTKGHEVGAFTWVWGSPLELWSKENLCSVGHRAPTLQVREHSGRHTCQLGPPLAHAGQAAHRVQSIGSAGLSGAGGGSWSGVLASLPRSGQGGTACSCPAGAQDGCCSRPCREGVGWAVLRTPAAPVLTGGRGASGRLPLLSSQKGRFPTLSSRILGISSPPITGGLGLLTSESLRKGCGRPALCSR